MMKSIRVAAVQFEHAAGDKAANLAKVEHFVSLAQASHVDIVVCPECCLTGYWFLRKLSRDALAELAEPVPSGPTVQALRELSRKTGMIIGAGLVEIDEEGQLYNCYVVAMPDGGVVGHRKLHTFVSAHMVSGDRFTTFDTALGWRLAVLTCYDNNIVENVRACALMGADLLLAPHQTGGCRSTNPHTMGLVDRELWDRREEDPAAIEAELCGPKGRGWLMRWLPSRAHDNGLFLVFSNGVGIDDDEIRTGNSAVFDPYGRILAETCKAGDDIVIADLDPSLLAETTGRRWIRTRRPELYSRLSSPTGLEVDVRQIRFDEKGV
jgi:predicted amidohydrolase